MNVIQQMPTGASMQHVQRGAALEDDLMIAWAPLSVRARNQTSVRLRELVYFVCWSLLLWPIVGGPLSAQASIVARPPAELLGEFRDDYGNSFLITDSLFLQRPLTRYRIIEWHVADRFLIAQNDTANPTDPALWTRIDWMLFTGMPPYTWGFCLTAYRAPTADAARATPAANRETPRTGCNGFPFSRMRRPE